MFHLLTGTFAHLAAAALAVLIYVLTTRVAQERRAPAAAIAWVIGLVLLPYLALPLYLAFGRRKLTRERIHIRAHLPSQSHWAAELLVSFGLPAPAPATTRFDADGAAALAAVLALIESAQRSLDVCSFILGRDAVGARVLQAMAQAQQRGVRVRLLLDGVGSLRADRSALHALRRSGAQVAFFRSLFERPDGAPRNLRDHRKLAIADSRRLWSGGRNLAAEYFHDRPGRPAWLDLSFTVEGAVAADAADRFERDWRKALHQPQPPPALPAPAEPPGPAAAAQFLPSGPELPEDSAQALLIAGGFRVRRRLLAITPYFVPDDGLQLALKLAALRGIEVDIVLPARSNHRLADLARRRSMRELAAAGARFWLHPHMLHAKAVVFDDDLAMCGSINLDLRSLFLNHEASVLFYGRAEIDWLAAWIEARRGEAQRHEPGPAGIGMDLLEGAVRAVAFQL
ncbi:MULTISPECIES: phospholipase D-like domain-containing protein [unclassified Lysobacter]|uniref:phospholipase D-like domain-containing protein n=1 Tax=unclassified Lysobacter TaxID=2635362 RepID=UPI0009EC6C27|nr:MULTISPECIES: phospholipase D-like domain-containing protein [unclassified Lysobacter]